MKTFSLSTLLLVFVIVALAATQVFLMMQLSLARAEVNDVRRKYGHILVTDKSKTYVVRIAENESVGDAYRLWIPNGSRYLLHLTDSRFDTNDRPTNPIPTKSIQLYDWSRGADSTLSCSIHWESPSPRVRVHTNTDNIFDYEATDWKGINGPGEWIWFQSSGQTAYSANQNIQFTLWRDKTTNRGILIWLEPYATWERRGLQDNKNATDPTDAR